MPENAVPEDSRPAEPEPVAETLPTVPVPAGPEPVPAVPDGPAADGSAPVVARRVRGFRQERRPGSPRVVVHKVKVTPEQEERLVARAGERGVTVSRLLVESALAGGAEAARTRAVVAGELFGMSRLLGRLGVNVNQIARATNVTRRVQPEMAAVLEATVRVCGRIEGFLDDVGGVRPADQSGRGGVG